MKAFSITKASCGQVYEGSNMAEAARVCGVSTTYMRKVLIKNLEKGVDSFSIKKDLFRIIFAQEFIDLAAKFADQAIKGKFVDGYLIKEGFQDDRNDCVIRALAWVLNIPYAEAHAIGARDMDRKRNRGVYDFQISNGLRRLADRGEIKSLEMVDAGMTINEFVERNPRGRFYCLVRGHAFAIINGLVYDNRDRVSGRHRIQIAWQIALK